MTKHQEIKFDLRDIECRVCGSTDSNKYGKYKDTQYYICKDCQSKFAGTNAYPKMKYPKMFNVMALTYYYNGMSYRNINQTFDGLESQRFSKSTLWNWITKFSKMGDLILSVKVDFEEMMDEDWHDEWTEDIFYGGNYEEKLQEVLKEL